jgi:outer membrane protein assembly factor BamB
VDEDPPVDEEPPEGGEPPWEETPTGEVPSPWDEGEEPANAKEPPWPERRPHAGEPAASRDEPAGARDEPVGARDEPADPAPDAHDDAPQAGDDEAAEDAEAGSPQEEEERPVAHEHEPLWGDDHPTTEQLSLEAAAAAGEAAAAGPVTGEGEHEAAEDAPAAEQPGDQDEPPWGTGPPPWERGGFWGDDEEEPAEGEGEAAAEGEAPLAAEDLTTRRAHQRVERRRAGQRRLAVLIAALVIVIVVIVVVTSGSSGTPGTNNGTTTASKFAHAGKGRSYLKIPFVADSGLTENVLIADRNNNRLLAISPKGQIVDNLRQETPSDAYLSSTGRTVFVTEHEQSVVKARRVDSGSVSYAYGVSRRRGSTDNRLHDPQTAQATASGSVVIADRGNCRILFVNPNVSSHKPVDAWGKPGSCTHRVTAQPFTFAFPDSAFAAPNGDIVVTEPNPAWVDVLNKDGGLISAVALSDFLAPQDANEYAPGKVIVVDRTRPGKLSEFDYQTSTTTVVPTWNYAPTSGNGELNKPSLAIVLPNGNVMVADAGNDRVIIIDPKTNKIVWQYGHKGKPGSKAGFLHTPDSIALVPSARPG